MSRVVQLCFILCCLVKSTLAVLTCTGENSISICTDDRRQGNNVSVNFESVPLYENNASCSCCLFAQSETKIEATYEYSSALDIVLVNTSIRLGNQTFQEATKGFNQLSANVSRKLHFNGDIGSAAPRVCLRFSSSSTINIEVVCMPNNNTTVRKSAVQLTPSSAEQSSSSTADVSQHEGQPRRINYTVIGGGVGGGFLVVAIVVVVVVIMCRRRRLSIRQNKEQNINMSVNQTEENTYNVENELYVSADDDILASGNHAYEVTHLQGIDVNHDKAKTTHDVTNNVSDSDNTNDQPDQYNPKQNVEKMNRCSNEYSVVFKNKNNTPSVDDTDTNYHVNRI